MRKFILTAAAAVGLSLAATTGANAAGAIEVPDESWTWEGLFGYYDKAQLQRGFQIYNEICSSCHGLSLVAYRNLQEIGFSEDQVKNIAAQREVEDGPDDTGEMFMRPALPADRFVSPFPNEEAARFANGGALPPDLSLMAKARPAGADYIYHLMLGYKDEAPEGFELGATQYYNEYFPGHAIGMPPQLYEGMVEYADGTEATAEQMAHDITGFLQWAAEPELEERKSLGIKVMLFLIVLTAMLYALKRRIWSDVEH
ncbi:ubiquinol cytochrome C oxidoreductase, cytochrome C1 subunit [Caenispirillum salinarum AK4]|uniref:Cytochrome c1 n=1 Tax=Caenispirillum salinarum AK4 TaxID=1238182 RepID=K9GNG7_9PROT|nr:cytochrome c1 [Caenispirillum salinarum]EKV26617.1 ubiquinol cytochrome C oxidoreductase, cytochrome C1 subunit [Caenispirillum salinarum AK4]